MRCTETVNILEIMRLSEMGLSQRDVGTSVKCGKSTVGDVMRRCRDAGLTYAEAEAMTSLEIRNRLYPAKELDREVSYPDWEALHKWLKGGKRRNLTYAWEKYRQEAGPDGLGYSQYCRLYSAWKDGTGKAVTMVQNHEPGEKAFIDWVGDTLDCVTDPATGEVQTAHFFVSVLGCSCYPYAEGFPNEQMGSWLDANTHSLEWYGGVPRIMVPDNTATAVTKAHYYDPKFNPTYLAFAQHYGFAVVPARPYKPKDKSHAEGTVYWLETWLLEWLSGQQFFSFEELNAAIRERLKALAERPFQKRPGSRRSDFEEFDRPALRSLPASRFDFAEYVTRSVPDSYHVEYDGFYYSVPFTLFRQAVTIRATSTMIEVIDGNRERVALHARRHSGSRYVTERAHMPEKHRRQAELSGRTGKDYLRWAETVGPSTRAVIERMLKAQAFEETAYRSCMGVLQYAKKHSCEQLEAACGRAMAIGSPNYTTVKNFLQNPAAERLTQPLPAHGNLRNPAEFS